MVNSDPECHRCTLANTRLGTTLRNHARLALHRNVKVAFSKL
ncbi:hypothetical protein HanPSC8_Chr03g0109151 [Helianthus annuus]|nr:hypothetical protein HanPSC8_Chr03g0109151 [Helianthus annuus]